jgi:hypothetical protein
VAMLAGLIAKAAAPAPRKEAGDEPAR